MSSDWVLLVSGNRSSLFGIASHPQPIYVSNQPKPLLDLRHLPPISAIRNGRVLVCWDPNWSRPKQRQVAQELGLLGAKQVAFIAVPLLISLTAARRTVLVVQLAYRHTTVSPVIFGQVFTSAVRRTSEPFLDLFRLFTRLDQSEVTDDDIVELMTIYGLANMQVGSPKRRSKIGFQSSHLPGHIIEFDTLLTICDDFARDTAELLLQSISRSPIDCRRSLMNSIVLSGGVASISGMPDLILDHIFRQLHCETNKKFHGLRSSVNVIKPNYPADILKWIGGLEFIISVSIKIVLIAGSPGCIAAQMKIPENCIAHRTQLFHPRFDIEQFQSQRKK